MESSSATTSATGPHPRIIVKPGRFQHFILDGAPGNRVACTEKTSTLNSKGSALGGYLGFLLNKDFGDFLEQNETFLGNVRTREKNMYAIPGQPTPTKQNQTLKGITNVLTATRPHLELYVTKHGLNWPKSVEELQAFSQDKADLPKLGRVISILKMLIKFPTVFKGSKLGSTFDQASTFDLEDVHRAMTLIAFYNRDRPGTGVPKTGDTASVIFTDGTIPTSSLSTAQASPTGKKQSSPATTTCDDPVAGMSFTERDDFAKLNSTTRRMLAEKTVLVEEDADSLLIAQAQIFSKVHGNLNEAVPDIPRVDRGETTEELLKDIADETFANELLPVAPAYLRTRSGLPSDPETPYKHSDSTESEPLSLLQSNWLEANAMDGKEREEYMHSSNGLEAEHHSVLDTGSYAEACDKVEFITAARPQRKTGTSSKPIEITPVQVRGAAWLWRMREETTLSGAILADKHGVGKTIEALLAMEKQAVKVVKEEQASFRPQIVVYPPQVLSNWLREFSDHFSQAGILKGWVLEGREKGKFARYNLSLDKLLAAKFAGDKDTLTLDENDPETARNVIFISYPKFAQLSLYNEETGDKEPELTARQQSIMKSKWSDEAKIAFIRSTSTAKVQERDKDNLSSIFAGWFDVAIIDEAHLCKDMKSRNFITASLLRPQFYVLLTATPLFNHPGDMCALLALCQPATFPKSFMGTLPRDPSEKQVIEYYQALDPTDPALAAVNTFDLLLSDGLLTTRAAEEVLSKIMAFVSISRSLATEVDRGPKFGGIWKAAKGVAPYDFHTLESIFGPNEKRTYTSVCSNWVPTFDNAGRNEESARKGNSRGFWSKVATRRLAIATFAPMLELAAIWGSGPKVTRLAQEQRIEKAFNSKDHGLSWLLGVVVEDPAIEPGSMTNAAMIARYLARRSPKLRALATILATHVPRRERVLVLAEHPATQWLIELFLMVVGLGVASIKQDTSREDRAELLTEFSNEASTKFDVLVSTVRLLGTGLNAHQACHVLVLPDAPRGSGYTFHAIGHIHRLGQEHRQYCYQLSVKDSHELANEFMAPRSSASTPAKRQRQGTGKDTESDDSSSDELPLKKLRHTGRQDSPMAGQDTTTLKSEPKPKLAPTHMPQLKSEDTP